MSTHSILPRGRTAFRSTQIQFAMQGIAVFAMICGVALLLGWLFSLPILENLVPAPAIPQISTGICFIATGTALWLLGSGRLKSGRVMSGRVGSGRVGSGRVGSGRAGSGFFRYRAVGSTLAALVAAVGLLNLLAFGLGIDIGMDAARRADSATQQIGSAFQPPVAQRVALVSMAPMSSLNFLLLGSGLCVLDARNRWLRLLAQPCAVLVMFISWLTLIGYAYGLEALHTFIPFASVSFLTALTFLLLGIGILFARPKRGVMELALAQSLGGWFFRRHLPLTVGCLVIFGWLIRMGARFILYPEAFGLVLLTSAGSVVLGILIYRTGESLDLNDSIHRFHQDEEQQASEERFRLMADSIPQLAWCARADGYIYWYNQRWYEFTGTTPAQMEGWGWQSVHDPELLPKVMENWTGAIASGQPFEMEFPLRSADGTFNNFLTRVNPLKDAEGVVMQWFGTNTNVDVLKRMEESLRASQAKLNSALAAGSIGTWTWDINQDCLTADEFTAHALSIAPAEAAAGLPVDAYLQAVLKDDQPRVADGLARAIETCGHYDIEYRVGQKNGELLWLQAKGRVEGDANGKAKYFHGAIMDITNRKRIEGRMHRLVDSNIQGVIFWNANGEITKANDAYLKMVGYNRDDLYAKRLDWASMTPPEYAHLDRYALSEMAVGGVCTPFEKEYIRKDGSRVPILLGAANFEDNANEGVCFLLDISERKRTDQALRASEERFRFLNDMSEATRPLADPEQIMVVTAKLLGEHMGVSRCAYADVEPDGDQFAILHDFTFECTSTVGTYQLSSFGTRAAATLRQGQTLVIRNVDTELLPDDGAETFNAIGIKAIITCPLVKDGVLRAMMAVHQTLPRDWKAEEVTTVEAVVERCWSTIKRRTAEEKIRQLNSELEKRIDERTSQLEAANLELRRSRAELKSLFESLPGLYLVMTPDLKIVAVSDAYLKATMTTRTAILGRGLFEVFPDNPADIEATGVSNLRASLDRVKHNRVQDTMAIQKYDVRRPDGVFEVHYWSPINSPVFGVDGEILFIVHRVEDVTDFVRQKTLPSGSNEDLSARLQQMEAAVFQSSQTLKAANSQLEVANKELEAFSYSVSHDLRAPLRAIDGFSRIVLNEYSPSMPPEAQEYLHDIRLNTQKMGHLVDDLLAFSRLSRQPLKMETVTTAAIVRQCLEELHREQAGRHVELQISELPACVGDQALLKQVWFNLLSNALKYTSKCAVANIEVGSFRDDRSLAPAYFIKDNGIGFDMNYAHKLFGVFQRLHRAEDYEGTGVGLAIVQRIIFRHGGRIWAQAEPGKGATFYFTLSGASQNA